MRKFEKGVEINAIRQDEELYGNWKFFIGIKIIGSQVDVHIILLSFQYVIAKTKIKFPTHTSAFL